MVVFNKFQNISQILTVLSISVIISSCANNKSEESKTQTTVDASTLSHTMAQCNQLSNSDIKLNTSVVKSNSGVISPTWMKLKFNQISAEYAQPNYKVKFYKWKIENNSFALDETQLVFMTYNISTKATQSNNLSDITVGELTRNLGFYINLNDSTATYQALRIVIEDEDQNVLVYHDTLIPQFDAIPAHYSSLNDGSVRSQSLQNLHILKNQDTQGWNTESYSNYFNQFCF